MNFERRFLQRPAKLETRGADGPRVIEGYAAVFYRDEDPGTEYGMYDDLVERLMPGCFNRALAEKADVRALFNHDADNILGRTAAGTLNLSIDDTGLHYAADVPDTQCGRDMVVSLSRGDVSGSSFCFRATDVTWREIKRDGGSVLIREVNDVDLYDVGPATFPAYASATAGVRAAGDAEREKIRAEGLAWRETSRKPALAAKPLLAPLGLRRRQLDLAEME